jgi:hypothetical protein
MAGQRRPLDRLAGGRARHQGRVDQPQLVAPAWSVGGDVLDGQGDQRPGPTKATVVGRGRWQVREQVAQPLAGEPRPAPLGAEPEQHLGDGQTHQLGVGELGTPAWPTAGTQQLVDGDVECDTEGVEVGAHEASQEVDQAVATSTLGALVPVVIPPHPQADSEAII